MLNRLVQNILLYSYLNDFILAWIVYYTALLQLNPYNKIRLTKTGKWKNKQLPGEKLWLFGIVIKIFHFIEHGFYIFWSVNVQLWSN